MGFTPLGETGFERQKHGRVCSGKPRHRKL